MFFPNECGIGKTSVPGDMFYPTSRADRYAQRAAEKAFSKKGRDDGMFFVVVAADPKLRDDVASNGTLIPFQPCMG